MSAAICTVLDTPIEDGSRDWRRALRLAIEGMRKQLRREREEGSSATYDCDGQIWRVKDLDDEELERVALTYSVRTVEQQIRQHESKTIEQRVKRRRGRAS